MLVLSYKNLRYHLLPSKYSEHTKLFYLSKTKKENTVTRNDGKPSSDNDNLICIPNDNEYYDTNGDGTYYEEAVFVLTDQSGKYIKDSHYEFYYNKNRTQKTLQDVI